MNFILNLEQGLPLSTKSLGTFTYFEALHNTLWWPRANVNALTEPVHCLGLPHDAGPLLIVQVMIVLQHSNGESGPPLLMDLRENKTWISPLFKLSLYSADLLTEDNQPLVIGLSFPRGLKEGNKFICLDWVEFTLDVVKLLDLFHSLDFTWQRAEGRGRKCYFESFSTWQGKVTWKSGNCCCLIVFIHSLRLNFHFYFRWWWTVFFLLWSLCNLGNFALGFCRHSNQKTFLISTKVTLSSPLNIYLTISTTETTKQKSLHFSIFQQQWCSSKQA